VSGDVTARLAVLPTAAISDAMDTIGIECALPGIAPLTERFRATGPAFTVRYSRAGNTPGSVGDFLDDVPAGAVVVIDNQGRTDVTVWGGIMTEVAAAKGVTGTVINGVCRDVTTSLRHGYPLFSCGRFMRTGKDRVRLDAVGEQLGIGGVAIAQGDIVCADADGALVVPAGVAERVVEIAERIEQIEGQIVAAARAGSTLRGARAEFGYHVLQRRSS